MVAKEPEIKMVNGREQVQCSYKKCKAYLWDNTDLHMQAMKKHLIKKHNVKDNEE